MTTIEVYTRIKRKSKLLILASMVTISILVLATDDLKLELVMEILGFRLKLESHH